MNGKVGKLIIDSGLSIIDALKLMDQQRSKLLIVMENQYYVGLISIGDIQRAIIRNQPLTDSVYSIMREDYVVSTPSQSNDEIKQIMLKLRAEFMPVVDFNRRLIDVCFWEDLFGDIKKEPLFRFSLPVIIMAGGIGSRLKPLTNVLPKPLIPIGDRTLLEEIFVRFSKHGCNDFYISVNYKSELIEYYIEKLELSYNIDFLRESKFMGTGGSLYLLKGKIDKTFFVSNCDILVDQDYSEVLNYHRENKNEITILAALKSYPIPYGTIETGENGRLINLMEKPEFTFKINSGMYILEPHLIDEIPKNDFFHITQLIEKVKCRSGSIGVFPVSEKSWIDIGTWSEYNKYLGLCDHNEKPI